MISPRELPRRIRLYVLARLFPLLFREGDSEVALARLGSQYGGWWVPLGTFNALSICYCVGVGEDASLDLALAEKFTCTVVSLDPTPKAIAYIGELDLPDELIFLPVGIAGSDGRVRFYKPTNPDHASYSMPNLQGTSRYIYAPVKLLSSVMRELGHSRLDFLKIDIEGAEYEVLESLHRDRLYPAVLCVEFDQPKPVLKTWRTVKKLRAAGYTVANVERFNFTLIRSHKLFE